jgi:choice-of-anchor B domain-containing protein
MRSFLALSLFFVVATAPAQTMYHPGSMGVGFGGAMAAGAGEIAVGSAPLGWQSGDEPPGSVYLYSADEAGHWSESGRLQASNGMVGDHFGRTVFMGGSHLVVGAPGAGAAYVFDRQSDGAWLETAILTPGSMASGAEFGGAYARGGRRTGNVAIADGRIMVTSFDAGTTSGAIHVFGEEGGVWSEEAALVGEEGEGFGYAVTALGDYIFAGVTGANDGAGAIDVFHWSGSQWEKGDRLAMDGLAGRSGFGSALAAGYHRLYAGASGMEGGGAVAVYELDDGVWAESSRLLPPSGDGQERPMAGFGVGVVTRGTDVLVGAQGAAVVFQDGQPSVLDAPGERALRGFGNGLALMEGTAVVGSPTADYDQGIASVFAASPEGWSFESILAPEVTYIESISGDQIDCEEGKAAIFDCADVDLISFMPTGDLAVDRGVELNDIWGWEDAVTGKEWVLQARTDGLAFVDISNPSYPVYVGQLMRTEGSPGAVWRDVKVYKDHAFIVADGSGEHGVQIFDLTQLRDVEPADMPVTFQETAHYSGVASTHNIVINEDTGFAFAVGNRAGGETCNGQSHMIDIRDPVNPKFAGCFSEERSRATHDAQCVTYHGADAAYVGHEICLSSNGSSFVISDVTDKESPKTVSFSTYPMENYTHQGWLTEDHNYFFMNDELDEMNGAVDHTRTLVWDVQDLGDPQLVNQFYLDSAASDHNLYVRGNLMYQSNYQAGLRILDITDPVNPVEVGSFDTAPYAEDAAGFGGSWSNYPFFSSGVIAVSSGSEGLFILKKRQVDS